VGAIRNNAAPVKPPFGGLLAFSFLIDDTFIMDTGETVYVLSRLLLGAAAAFFAIMLWSRTRDMAWMFVAAGTLAAYVETVYSILNGLGIVGERVPAAGFLSLLSIVLPCLPAVFLTAAFAVMAARKYRFGRGW
jgi:hypothetical protein